MKKQRTAIAVIVFGVLTGIGGLIGYMSAHSMPSLIGGFVMGLLLLICGFAMMKKSVLGYFSACLLTALLLFFFGYRFFNTGKIAPAGVMSLASLGVFALLITSKPKK